MSHNFLSYFPLNLPAADLDKSLTFPRLDLRSCYPLTAIHSDQHLVGTLTKLDHILISLAGISC
jgi:hypothetical protein